MPKILLPYDGSASAQRATDYLIELYKTRGELEVLLLNVQDLSALYSEYITADLVESLRNSATANGLRILQEAEQKLGAAGVKYSSVVVHGDVAANVQDQTEKEGCSAIVMGTRGMGALSSLLVGSVAQKVIHAVKVPVTLVK